jgi:hypothetical protein
MLWKRISPVALWYSGNGRLEAVGVIATVTAITEQQRILILPSMAELKIGNTCGKIKIILASSSIILIFVDNFTVKKCTGTFRNRLELLFDKILLMSRWARISIVGNKQ